jgi:N-carbamoylputrescine amidase
MRILAASVQMESTLGKPAVNLERADSYISEAVRQGAELIALPELFCCGYGFGTDYGKLAGTAEDSVVGYLKQRARQWRIGIAAGIAMWHGGEVYNAICFAQPDGRLHYYSKRKLVFWEPFVFRHGQRGSIVPSPWGRIGLAICADMIYSATWRDYRDRIDLAIVSSAWPEFACSRRGRPNWLLGRLGPLCRDLPHRISKDLDVPVIFSNQAGATRTRVPLMNAWLEDRFAGASAVVDARSGTDVRAGLDSALVLGEISLRGPSVRIRSKVPEPCRSMSALGRTA